MYIYTEEMQKSSIQVTLPLSQNGRMDQFLLKLPPCVISCFSISNKSHRQNMPPVWHSTGSFPIEHRQDLRRSHLQNPVLPHHLHALLGCHQLLLPHHFYLPLLTAPHDQHLIYRVSYYNLNPKLFIFRIN